MGSLMVDFPPYGGKLKDDDVVGSNEGYFVEILFKNCVNWGENWSGLCNSNT